MNHVGDVMTSTLVTIDRLLGVREAEKLAASKGVHHLVVVEGDWPAGIVCVHDLEHADRAASIGQVMSAPVETIWAQASVSQAATCMRHEHVGCLAVVANGHLVGIVTRRDLRRAGISQEETGGAECAACKAHHHLEFGGDASEVCFCADCLDRLPEPELGGGD
jgi:predicted transcriptional regulator